MGQIALVIGNSKLVSNLIQFGKVNVALKNVQSKYQLSATMLQPFIWQMTMSS